MGAADSLLSPCCAAELTKTWHSRDAQPEGMGWNNLNTLDWTPDQKKNVRGTVCKISVKSREWLLVCMDVDFLVLITVPWL